MFNSTDILTLARAFATVRTRQGLGRSCIAYQGCLIQCLADNSRLRERAEARWEMTTYNGSGPCSAEDMFVTCELIRGDEYFVRPDRSHPKIGFGLLPITAPHALAI